MRILWLRARVFVHATEDEERVRQAMLALLGLPGDARGLSRVDRHRLKGHYGNDITILETSLKKEKEARASLSALLTSADVRGAVRDTLLRRLDEDGVLHLRLDKQEAVQGRVALTDGSDALVVRVKAGIHPPERIEAAWHRQLTAAPSA